MIERLDTDVIVVGSGAAGAAVAARCAEGGARVVVLEEGAARSGASFDGDVLGAVRTMYRNAGALVALGDPPVVVQVGCVVGGSTVINGGTSFRTPPEVLKEWSEKCGGAFTPEQLAPYFAQVETDLSIVRVPPELAFIGERWLLEAARGRGLEADYVLRNVKQCQGTGLCAFGCPTGAKQSVERTYLPRASRRGAEVRARHRVDRVRIERGSVQGVEATELDSGRRVLIDAPLVAVCAGALHTPLLLRRSLGRQTPPTVGRHLFLHPAGHVVGIRPEPIGERMGPIQSVYVADPEHRYVIFGMGYPPEVYGAFVVEHGADAHSLGDWRKSIGVAVMASDHGAGGRIVASGREPVPFYSLGDEEGLGLYRGMAHAAELLLEIGCERVYVSARGVAPITTTAQARALAESPPSKKRLMLGSVHPMGSARMGQRVDDAALDPNHQVFGVRGLYVPDASFFPSSLGVNPQVTIMAFALRCADAMLR